MFKKEKLIKATSNSNFNIKKKDKIIFFRFLSLLTIKIEKQLIVLYLLVLAKNKTIKKKTKQQPSSVRYCISVCVNS